MATRDDTTPRDQATPRDEPGAAPPRAEGKTPAKGKRRGLKRERIVAAALALADEQGIEALTIRRLAAALGVGPMSIYHYFPNKDAIIDAMVDAVFAEIALPPEDLDWKRAVRVRCVSAREALRRHPWAPAYMESRTTPGPATLRHHDAVLGCFRRGGLSLEMTAHAYAILDSFIYGFALEEANLPSGGSGEDFQQLAEAISATFPRDEYPHLAEFTFEYVLKPGYGFERSFEFGLDLIIEGIDAAAQGQG